MNPELWEIVQLGVRALVAIVAGIVGWYASGLTIAVVTRLAFHRRPSGFAAIGGRLLGAGMLALLVWLFLPLGMGGFGTGDGLGKGKGNGPPVAANNDAESPKIDPVTGEPLPPALEIVAIELLGGERYQGEGRFYLVNRKEPAKNLDEVRRYFEEHKERLEIRIILTPDSVAENHPAVRHLQSLAQEYQFPAVVLPERMP